MNKKQIEAGCPSCLYLRLREEVDELARQMVHGTEEEVTDQCGLTASLILGIVNSLDQLEVKNGTDTEGCGEPGA